MKTLLIIPLLILLSASTFAQSPRAWRKMEWEFGPLRTRAVVAAAPAPADPLKDSVYWWSMESLTDETSTFTLVAFNKSTKGDTVGVQGNAAIFKNDSSQYWHVSNNNLTNMGGPYTVSFWVKEYNTTGLKVMFSKGTDINGLPNTEIGLFTSAGGSQARAAVGAASLRIDFARPSAVAYSMITVTYDPVADSMSVYFDGVLDEAIGTAGDAKISPLFTIAASGSATQHFYGAIDELAYWRGVSLKPSDVALLYNSGSGHSYTSWVAL